MICSRSRPAGMTVVHFVLEARPDSGYLAPSAGHSRAMLSQLFRNIALPVLRLVICGLVVVAQA